ncbi:MAG: TlpA disulfide reductase family protein [Marinoscillum sp.]|uniref:TlpA family protein disulfide reductase n=1 Tax=Marinoscillum sp. TaxID=2024838 RepID=UPI0032F869A6
MSKKSYRKELIEWAIIVVVGLTLYVTGLHTEVIGQIQRVVLATGIMQPEADDEKVAASYDLRLSNIAGRTVSFATFKGQTVFLNFWATWCPPCIAEMPDIEDLYQKMGKDVTFVMISLDEDRDKARRFVERKGFELPVYFLESPLPAPYNPSSIPTTYVISPEGQVVLTRHGMAKYDTEEFRLFLSEINSE